MRHKRIYASVFLIVYRIEKKGFSLSYCADQQYSKMRPKGDN